MSSASTRCPRCSAALVGDLRWCSLCYLDLRPPAAPPEAPPPPAPPGHALATSPRGTAEVALPAVGASAPPHAAEGAEGRRRGRHARPEPSGAQPPPGPAPVGSPLDPEVAARVDAMLEQLAAEPRTEIDGVLARFETQGARIALMLGGTAVLTLVLFLVLFVVGLVLD